MRGLSGVHADGCLLNRGKGINCLSLVNVVAPEKFLSHEQVGSILYPIGFLGRHWSGGRYHNNPGSRVGEEVQESGVSVRFLADCSVPKQTSFSQPHYMK